MDLTLKDFAYDAQRCLGCKACVWVDHIFVKGVKFSTRCPSLTKYLFDAYSCYGRQKIALALMEGQLEYSPKLLDVVYTCQMCGACDAGCKRNLDLEPLLVMETLRSQCVKDGQGPMPEHKNIAQNIGKSNNRYPMSHSDRCKWIPDEIKPSAKADVIYFVGCASSYRTQEISRATAQILSYTNMEFMLLNLDEWCCGYPLYSTGQIKLFEKQVEHNIEAVKKAGAKTVLLSCAEGYKTWKVDYPKVCGISTADMDFKVIHVVEYIGKLIQEDKLTFNNRVDMKVTYHDPCNLGRLSEPWIHWEGRRGKWGKLTPPKEFRRGSHGVYQPPRDILNAIPGISLIEMERIRENAWCCGAGGGVGDAFQEFALWTANERIEEAMETGAEAIVSCCPHCKMHFQNAVNTSKKKMKVYDIIEIIAAAISEA
ncbi:MAG: (Fe-S)-binding protein [Thermodesulfobacteriota bacterium]